MSAITHHTSQHLLILLALSTDNTPIALLNYGPQDSVSIHNLDDHIQSQPMESPDTSVSSSSSSTQTRGARDVLDPHLLLRSPTYTQSPFAIQLLSSVFATTAQLQILQELKLTTQSSNALPPSLLPLLAQVGGRVFLQSVEQTTQFARLAPLRATVHSTYTQSFPLMEDPPRETTEVVRLTLFPETCDDPYHIHQADQSVFAMRKENTGVIYIVSPDIPPPAPNNHRVQLSIDLVPIGIEHPERNIVHTHAGRVAMSAAVMDRVFLC